MCIVDNEIVKDIIEYPEDTLQTKQNNKVIKCEENNEPTMEKNVQHEEGILIVIILYYQFYFMQFDIL